MVEPLIAKQRLIEVAKSFIGVRETSPNSGPEIEAFQSAVSKPQGQPWCVDFLLYCAGAVDKELGSSNVLYKTESSLVLYGRTQPGARVADPEPGCVVVWQKYNKGIPQFQGHCGIVIGVGEDETIETIEGNTGPGQNPGEEICRDGDGVYSRVRHRHPTGSLRLLGYLRPWLAPDDTTVRSGYTLL